MNENEILIDGIFQIYQPFKFTYKQSLNDQYQLLNFLNDEIVIGFYQDGYYRQKMDSSNYYNDILKTHKEDTSKYFNDINKDLNLHGNESELFNSTTTNIESRVDIDSEIFIDDSNSKFSLTLSSNSYFLSNWDYVFGKQTDKISLDEQIYGHYLINNRIKSYILFPIRFQLDDEKIDFVNVYMEIFDNSSVVLKFEFRFEKLSEEQFRHGSLTSAFKKLWVPNFLLTDTDSDLFEFQESSESDLYKIISSYYINYLEKYFKKKSFNYQSITHTIITNQNSEIDNLHNISNEMKEFLYRITFRPIDPILSVSNRIAELDDHSWGGIETKTFCSSSGNLVSIMIDNYSVPNSISQNLEGADLNFSGSETTLSLNELEKFISIDHAIDIPLKLYLVKILNHYLLSMEYARSNKNFESIKADYLTHEILYEDYLVDLYGTAKDLIYFLNSHLQTYHNSANGKKLLSNFEEMQSIEYNIRVKRIDKYILIMSFFLTIVFALPTLNETILMVNDSLDMKYNPIEIKNFSFAMWTLLVIVQIIYFIWGNINHNHMVGRIKRSSLSTYIKAKKFISKKR